MENHKNVEVNYSFFYILGLVFGVLIALVISESVMWTILGGIIGLLFSAFFVNALVKDREV